MKIVETLSPLTLLVSTAIWAAPIPLPNAGSLENQLRQEAHFDVPAPVAPALVLPANSASQPRTAADNSTVVVIRQVHFIGDVLQDGINEAMLQKIIEGDLNKPLTFSDLQQVTEKITARYRQSGMLLVRAILPAQTIHSGKLTIQIVPGRYDEATVNNATTLRSQVIQHLVLTTTPTGEVIRRGQLERVALLLNEIPGVNARVALSPGKKTGTSALDINVTPGQRVGGYIGLDNQGDPNTGRSRVMAGGYANNLLGIGDLLKVDLLDAYEKSDLFSGSLDYSLLAGGYYGIRGGINYSHLNYRYNLNKLGFNGDSDNLGVYVSQPLVRQAQARVDLRADAQTQSLTDHYPVDFGSGTQGRKQVNLGDVSVQGSLAYIPGGVTGFVVTGTVGNVDLRNDVARTWSGMGSDGQFSRLNYQFNHEQHLWGPLSLYANLMGQQTNHNLDSSQRFLMGGPTGVRAYDIGDGAVNNGNIMTAELRSQWPVPVPRSLGRAPTVTVATFYDQGWGRQMKDNNVAQLPDNNINLSGAGLYASLGDAGNYALNLTWAHRTGDADPSAVHDDHDRFWISAVKSF